MKPRHGIWAFVPGQAQLESALELLRRAGLEACEVSILAPYERLESFGQSILAPQPGRKRARKRKNPLEWLDRKGVVDIAATGPLVATGDLLTTLLQPDARAALQRMADCARTLAPAQGNATGGGVFPYILIAAACPDPERLARAAAVLQPVCDSVFPAEAFGFDTPIPNASVEKRVEDAEPYSDLYNGAVAQVMDRDVPYVEADAPLHDALHAMRSLEEEFLPVVAGDKMVGLLTNSDVPARPVPENGPEPALVRDAMIPDFVYCFDDEEAGQAAQVMEKSHVSRVPVLDRTGKLVGMVRSIPLLDSRVYEPHLSD